MFGELQSVLGKLRQLGVVGIKEQDVPNVVDDIDPTLALAKCVDFAKGVHPIIAKKVS